MKLKTQSLLTAVVAGAALAAGSTNAATLTAYWDFEGSTPDNVEDSVSNTAGILSGTASTAGTAVAPTGSSSLSLDGSATSFFDAETDGGLGGTGSFTVLAFIDTTMTSDGNIFSYSPSGGGTAGAGLRLFIKGNGNLRIEMNQGAGFELDLSTAGIGGTELNLNDGASHLIAAVFDSSTGDSFLDVDLYVDGAFFDVAGGTDHTINLGTSAAANGDVTIGNFLDDPNDRDFDGLIDDVAIYSDALTLSELDDIAANGVPEPGSLALLGLGGLMIARRRRG